jgi:CheY-like chemotaxis protein
MKRILVVDDEQDVRIYLSRLFQENGYNAECAGDGAEALVKVRDERPDLVTLDLSMPETSGVRFYREVRTDPELARIPVVLVTAVTGPGGNPADTERFYRTRHGVPPPDGFVPKPVDPGEILALVGRLIGPGEAK